MLAVVLTTSALLPQPARLPQSRILQRSNRAAVTMGPVEPDETWTTTSSGLKYLDTAPGEGEQPEKGASVTVGYTGWTMDGNKFDSGSIDFNVGTGRVIAGWDEGIQTMRVGSSRKMYIPAELGYGERENGEIPANSPLYFECELKAINSGIQGVIKSVPGALLARALSFMAQVPGCRTRARALCSMRPSAERSPLAPVTGGLFGIVLALSFIPYFLPENLRPGFYS